RRVRGNQLIALAGAVADAAVQHDFAAPTQAQADGRVHAGAIQVLGGAPDGAGVRLGQAAKVRIDFVGVGGNGVQAVRYDDAVEQIERQAFQRTYFSHVATSLGIRPGRAWTCCSYTSRQVQGQ